MKKEITIECPKGYEVDKENSTFEKIVFKKNKEEINSLEDAIAYLGEKDSTVKQLRLLNSLHEVSDKIVSEIEMEVVTKALNQKWTPNWKDNNNKAKWFIWWDLENNCFSFVDYYCHNASASSRLCFKSKELALKAVEILSKQLSNYYKY